MVLHSPSVPVLTILLVYHFSILIRYIEVSLLVGMECLIAIQCFIAPSSRWHAFRVWFIFYEMNSCKSTQIEMPVTTITGSALVIQTSTGYKFLFHLTSQRKLPQQKKKTPRDSISKIRPLTSNPSIRVVPDDHLVKLVSDIRSTGRLLLPKPSFPRPIDSWKSYKCPHPPLLKAPAETIIVTIAERCRTRISNGPSREISRGPADAADRQRNHKPQTSECQRCVSAWQKCLRAPSVMGD